MSYTNEVISELMEVTQGKTCCRKAFLFGMFFAATTDQNNRINAEFRGEEIAISAAEILKRQFSSSPEITKFGHAGRYLWRVSANTKALASFLRTADKEGGKEEISNLVGFRCGGCANSFLRGVFIASGSVNDPKNSYHLEFLVRTEERAGILSDFLSEVLAVPKMVKRSDRIGLYYKKNLLISDILYYLGGVQSGFGFSNVCIERDIRNDVNRATNCVAKNISRAVDASAKHVEAIELLESTGKMQNLSEELRYTARLRMENLSVPLAELARLHEPPISKSGLNRRLVKIMEEAEALKNEK